MRSGWLSVGCVLVAGCLGGAPLSGVSPGGTEDGFDPGTGVTPDASDSQGPDLAGTTGVGADLGTDPLNAESNPFIGLKSGPTQLASLCARNNGDPVSKAFCTPTPPVITSLVDLQVLLGLDFKAGNIANGTGGNPAFVLTGHSSSLVAHFTNAINPRAIIFTPPNSRGRVGTPKPLATFVAMGFVRGEQFVELIANDPSVAGGKALNFFLFKFEQACSSAPGGCTEGDLLTPTVEKNYTGYTLYQDSDINNTVFDCLQCHQTTGPGTQKTLRQQELQNPWGHFFRNNRSNGIALFDDYGLAHGPAGFTNMSSYLTDQKATTPTLKPASAETYAGIPGDVIFNSNTTNNNGNQTAGGGPDPAALEGLIENQGFQVQPNEFNSGKFLDKDPAVSGWMTIFANVLSGTDIPVPYYNNKVSDPTKITALTAAYVAVMKGTTPLASLPDIRNAFLDAAAPFMTFSPATPLVAAGDGKGIMVQVCQQCHNPNLDQTLSRAKFDVTKLGTMDPLEKQKAITRLNLDPSAFRKMPPPRFRSLTPAEITLVTAELMK